MIHEAFRPSAFQIADLFSYGFKIKRFDERTVHEVFILAHSNISICSQE